ncbi:hypothetical protein [Novosphingobium resinovorum]|uniref:Uncharacterized protein n=1 Tax=Novosphingobium resinovorum TaxID=158500 RepID=A0A1D8A3E2_9SPHN|nr:hypothetical protein [Novosphingobium resinovorum]AOR76572.1 hypothetical protein BES08_07280 [Novosphingobium resinovorum]
MPTYTEPFKLRLQKALSACLAEITPANGFVSDLSAFDPGDGVFTPRVYRGRAWFGDNDPLPMVSTLEGVDPASEVAEPPASEPTSEYDYDLLIQGWVTDDPANPTDTAYVLLADVRQKLAAEAKRRLPHDRTEPDIFGLKAAGSSASEVTKLRFGSGVVRPADELSSTAWFWLSITVRIVENASKPYD